MGTDNCSPECDMQKFDSTDQRVSESTLGKIYINLILIVNCQIRKIGEGKVWNRFIH